MLPPQKPWENATLNQRVPSHIPNSDGIPSSIQNVGQYGGFGGVNVRSVRNPPPIPPRPSRQRYQSGYNVGYSGSNYYSSPFSSFGGYGSNYNSYSNYGYGGLGGYGSYNNYNTYGGFGSSRYGFGPSMPESRFIQMAEDGTRPAFQSIESLVHAFGSVSFMLESTFNAMYSSFRAVLGVAENFGRLRALFGQFLSVFAVFRWLQWMYRKCLFILGFRSSDPGQERLWREATDAVTGGNLDSENKRTSWPIMVFLGIILSGPYLMWKLLSSVDIPNVDPYNTKDWARCKEPILASIALYDFPAASPQELSLRTGQKILVAPKDCQQSQSWLLASVDGQKVGLIPANYIKVLGRTAFQTKNVGESHSDPSSVNEEIKIDESALIEPVEPSIPASHIPGPSGNVPIGDTVSHKPMTDTNTEEEL